MDEDYYEITQSAKFMSVCQDRFIFSAAILLDFTKLDRNDLKSISNKYYFKHNPVKNWTAAVDWIAPEIVDEDFFEDFLSS